jgi:nucleotide-binding universal stress UspA family protein
MCEMVSAVSLKVNVAFVLSIEVIRRDDDLILIAYDGSEDARCAIDQAGALMSGEPATVLTVWERFVDTMTRTGAGLGLIPGIVEFDDIDKASARSARARAVEGAQRATLAGLTAQPDTRAQDRTIAATILAEADAVGASTIVIGTRGLTGVKSLLLGSVSHALLQYADRPVIVVPSPEIARERVAHGRGTASSPD